MGSKVAGVEPSSQSLSSLPNYVENIIETDVKISHNLLNFPSVFFVGDHMEAGVNSRSGKYEGKILIHYYFPSLYTIYRAENETLCQFSYKIIV